MMTYMSISSETTKGNISKYTTILNNNKYHELFNYIVNYSHFRNKMSTLFNENFQNRNYKLKN